jgi:uncharacterized membrane protein YqjE
MRGLMTSVVDALRHQPALLVIILLNAMVLGAVSWSLRDARNKQHELTTTVLTQLAHSQELLAKCAAR